MITAWKTTALEPLAFSYISVWWLQQMIATRWPELDGSRLGQLDDPWSLLCENVYELKLVRGCDIIDTIKERSNKSCTLGKTRFCTSLKPVT